MPANPQTPNKPPQSPGRANKRDVILQAARTLFLEHGFASTSVDAVTELSGVSKPTVYNHFATKEALLEGVVRQESTRLSTPVEFRITGNSLHDLESLARTLLTLALSPEVLAWDRMMAGEAHRKPELGKLFFDHGPGQMMKLIAGFFRKLTPAGEIQIEDYDEAAEFFFGLVIGVPLLRGQLCNERLPEHLLKTRSKHAARRFLRAYSAEPQPKSKR